MSQSTTVPEDVLRGIATSEAQERDRIASLVRASTIAEQERAMLQKKVYDVANPSPIYVTILVLAVLIFMYFVYVLFLKPCMSGEWMDHAGNTWDIAHNRFNGHIKVKINGVCKGSGKVLDNYVQYGDLVGVWNYGNVVAFTEGWHLERVQYF